MKLSGSVVFLLKQINLIDQEAIYMRRLVKGFIIGTAIVVLGTTAVFAAGNGAGPGRGQNNSQSAASLSGDSVSSTATGSDSTSGTGTYCQWCQDRDHCYNDLDNDGVCDYYKNCTGENCNNNCTQNSFYSGTSSGHHGMGQNRGHHGACN